MRTFRRDSRIVSITKTSSHFADFNATLKSLVLPDVTTQFHHVQRLMAIYQIINDTPSYLAGTQT